MTSSSFNADRLRAAGRRVLPWLVGPAVLVIRGRALELATPSACPGLLELITIGAVRLSPGLRIGHVFDLLHAAVVVAALAAFVALVVRHTRNGAVAAATGLAVGLSPLFPATLSPPWEAAAFGICAAAALLAGSEATRRQRFPWSLVPLSLAMLLAGALLVPPWFVVSSGGALVVGIVAWPRVGLGRRWAIGCAAAATLALLALAVLSLSPPDLFSRASSWRALAPCVLPVPSAARGMAIAGNVGWLFGPFALALALLGAFVEAPRAGWRPGAATAGIGIVCLALASGAGMSAAVAIAPAAVILWWLAAAGLDEVITAIGRGKARVVAAALILLLLPTLEASRRVTEQRDDWVRPRGHEMQTLGHMTMMLNLVEQNATFVEEDSTVDILLRASVFGGRRKGKPFTVVAPRPDAVSAALVGRTVYAFPRQQGDLSLRGFVVEPLTASGPGGEDRRPEFDGVAVVTGTRPCQTMGDTWADLTGASGRIALSADSEAAHGPVVLYLGGESAVDPSPDGWPPRTNRGFGFFTYDQRAVTHSDRLAVEARDVGLGGGHPVVTQPFVVRLNLHRTPRAPLALAVTLGASFPVGVGKLDSNSADVGRLRICDAPKVSVSPFLQRD